MSRVAGAVLAAGSGTRMGAPKADLQVDGQRLLDRAVAALADGGCDPVLAVVRAGTDVAGARALVNDDPARGLRSSLAVAVDAAAELGVDALVVLLVDQPGITAAAVRAVVAAWHPGRITAASYAGRTGHPIAMAPDSWREALGRAGPDEGARGLLRSRTELIDAVPVDGDATDLDTPEDVRRWRSRP